MFFIRRLFFSNRESLNHIVLMGLSALVIVMGMMAFINTKAGQRIPFIREIAAWLGIASPEDQANARQIDFLKNFAFTHQIEPMSDSLEKN